jgi:hypothetical protein
LTSGSASGTAMINADSLGGVGILVLSSSRCDKYSLT